MKISTADNFSTPGNGICVKCGWETRWMMRVGGKVYCYEHVPATQQTIMKADGEMHLAYSNPNHLEYRKPAQGKLWR